MKIDDYDKREITQRVIDKLKTGWIKKYWALDASGNPALWYRDEAVVFGASGAFMRITYDFIKPRQFKTDLKEAYEALWDFKADFFSLQGKDLGKFCDDAENIDIVIAALEELKQYYDA